jgi:hypothetical protein
MNSNAKSNFNEVQYSSLYQQNHSNFRHSALQIHVKQEKKLGVYFWELSVEKWNSLSDLQYLCLYISNSFVHGYNLSSYKKIIRTKRLLLHHLRAIVKSVGRRKKRPNPLAHQEHIRQPRACIVL